MLKLCMLEQTSVLLLSPTKSCESGKTWISTEFEQMRFGCGFLVAMNKLYL